MVEFNETNEHYYMSYIPLKSTLGTTQQLYTYIYI